MKNKLANFVKPALLGANFRLGRYKKVVWVIGSGRSGTTWVSDMINYNQGFREILEPCRPHIISESGFLQLNQYERTNSKNDALLTFYSKVFSGEFQHIDADSAANKLWYNGLLIKDVFANLFAHNLKLHFPQINIILLLRNPFDVARSMQKLKSWTWMTEPSDFLKQHELVDDFLLPYVGLIREVSNRNDHLEKLILIWCIIYYVPLKQFEKNAVHVVFYEDMVKSTNAEVNKVWEFVNGDKTKTQPLIPQNVIQQSSSVSQDLGKTVILSEKKKWSDGFTEEQIANGKNILKAFGFEKLYNDQGEPNKSVLNTFF